MPKQLQRRRVSGTTRHPGAGKLPRSKKQQAAPVHKMRLVTPEMRAARTRKLARTPGAHWRFQTGGSLEVKARGGTRFEDRFDEVVVDDWLHAEMMGARSVFVNVGGLALWLRLTKDGARVSGAEIRAEGDERKELVKALSEELRRGGT
jgi:hypothetical protein